ncbi:Endo-type membrane-bound lytic murein transglycosylase A [Cocos nucifera]|uniref:Endo-type membrane-bound lytic murein transglycosylase A n=1 Tax=Cocos nucifera TaxID=13894 RepID=A0A8K0MUG2_COCNU|nr:Endo-type membrane-bound lytic murein transglycosylase A [Cocos nucifera]
MSVSYKYWDDCVESEDMKSMWMDAEVRKEWDDVGETMGQKVHLSQDPDGEPYITEVEMKAVAKIVVHRHFDSQLDPDVICAIAEISSGRQIVAQQYDRKNREMRIGIMQIVPDIAEWLVREMGYRNYNIEGDPTLLYRPFVNVYFGAAYIKWLSCYDGKDRSEEFVIRAYKGGIKKATHKSTKDYFQRYLSVKQILTPSREQGTYDNNSLSLEGLSTRTKAGEEWTYWDSRVSPSDMEELWNNPDVLKEWTKSGERHGRVRFSHNKENRPYLSRVEVKAVAEIIISRYFSSRGVQSTALAALAEVVSMRFVNGARARTGLMGIDYPTAVWLYKDLGCRAYEVKSVDDLYNPFVSMYFGAAYLSWLSEYEGRQRSHEFIVQAYLGGPENVNIQETGPFWNRFQEALSYYEDSKKDSGSCYIL